MDIPSLFMIPSAVSSGKVHSVFPNSTDADFDFNRDSDATRVNSEGLIERVGYYGSELVTNGGFDADTNWSKDGWKIENGKAINTLASSGLNLYQGGVTSVGNTFKVVLDAVISAGGLKILLGGGSGGYNEIGQASATGTHTFAGVSNGTDNRILIQTLSGSTIGSVIVDNVSVKQINGDRARLNYEIEGGLVNTKPSLLLEPQSTNLVTYSDNFSQISLLQSTITTNNIKSPNGLIKGNLWLANATSAAKELQEQYSVTSGTTYTESWFVKYKSLQFIQMVTTSATFGAFYGNFDLVNGTKGNSNYTNCSIEAYPDGWYRIQATQVATSTGTGRLGGLRMIASATASRGGSITTDGTEGVYVWGHQVEQQSYATSYIPTNGSTQTRAAETCIGAGTSSIFESSEGILYCEIAALADNFANYRFISLYDGTYDNFCDIYYGDASNRISVRFRGGGGTVINMFFAISDIMLFNKVAISWKLNKFKFFINGVSRGLNTSGAAPVGLDRLDFSQTSGSNPFYGKIRDIRVYNTKEMTDSEVDILLTKITS